MSRKIICPWHKEKTPSLVMYRNGFFCYGCGKRGPLKDLGGIAPAAASLEEAPPEDVEETIKAIRANSHIREVRGLQLPANSAGYYIIWPDDSYYKLRFWDPDAKPKYIGARGVSRGLFWATRDKAHNTLILCEGELNALSIAACGMAVDVVSPGGVSDFTAERLRKYLPTFSVYDTIVIVADADGAGLVALVDALGYFKACGIKSAALPLSPDPNKLLVDGEQQRIKDEITRAFRKALDAGIK